VTLRVCIAGITGWIGRPLAEAVEAADDLALVAGVARGAAGQAIGAVVISGSMAEALGTPFEVFVEYTSAETAKEHALAAVRDGRHVVIGSSGLTTSDFDEIDGVAREHAVGVVAVGNFALTAALLQRFAVEAAAHLPAWEIIDTASAGKRDAPSGMARELAWRLCEVGAPSTEIPVGDTVGAVEARGADVDGSRIHSVRLPGYTIGLEVRFGQADERLTISYDAGPGAGPYIAGTLLAIRRVPTIVGLVRGLDRLI
jgi:4-hydroxy-tetrahydrodipicolinate reductase